MRLFIFTGDASMLVFRCACEQVLGIDEQDLDKLGECPSCGRILRVPKTSVNLSGKLKSMKAAAAAEPPPAPGPSRSGPSR